MEDYEPGYDVEDDDLEKSGDLSYSITTIEGIIHDDLIRWVHKEMETIHPRKSKVITLILSGIPCSEISNYYGVCPKTIYEIYSKGVNILKHRMETEPFPKRPTGSSGIPRG